MGSCPTATHIGDEPRRFLTEAQASKTEACSASLVPLCAWTAGLTGFRPSEKRCEKGHFTRGLMHGRFAACFPQGGDVLETADRQTQIEFGQERLQEVGQALRTPVRQGVCVGAADPDGRRAPSASAMIRSVASRTPESNITGVEPAALTTPGSSCSVEIPEFA